MWNFLELQCPASDLVQYPPADQHNLEYLRDFVTVLTTAAATLTSENPLWNEMKVLNNIQAKYKRILRCDRFLIFLQRVGHCLRKMVLLNLSKSYTDLAERFLIGFQDPSGTPSRQQVEYILIRTLSASRLVSEAITYSRESFCYLIQKLKVGHLILDLIMATSIIARVNILLRATLKQLCSIYKQVLFWRLKVRKGKFQWAEEFDFPEDVEEWIKISDPSYSKPLSMSAEEINKVKLMLKQATETVQEVELNSDAESVVMVDDVSSSANISRKETDFGEVIPRKVNQTSKKQKVRTFDSDDDVEDAIQYIKELSENLTSVQKALLEKIVKTRSLKQLEDLWSDLVSKSQESFPALLRNNKKRRIKKLFLNLKNKHPYEIYNNTSENKPELLKVAILHLCEMLGFSGEQIAVCEAEASGNCESSKKAKVFSVSEPLLPVKTVKKLRLLYWQLREMLEFKKEYEKLKLLKTIFKHRIADIKRLKENNKKVIAKKLIVCTSKEFLALYQ